MGILWPQVGHMQNQPGLSCCTKNQGHYQRILGLHKKATAGNYWSKNGKEQIPKRSEYPQ